MQRIATKQEYVFPRRSIHTMARRVEQLAKRTYDGEVPRGFSLRRYDAGVSQVQSMFRAAAEARVGLPVELVAESIRRLTRIRGARLDASTSVLLNRYDFHRVRLPVTLELEGCSVRSVAVKVGVDVLPPRSGIAAVHSLFPEAYSETVKYGELNLELGVGLSFRTEPVGARASAALLLEPISIHRRFFPVQASAPGRSEAEWVFSRRVVPKGLGKLETQVIVRVPRNRRNLAISLMLTLQLSRRFVDFLAWALGTERASPPVKQKSYVVYLAP
jgi:hypothetical protein